MESPSMATRAHSEKQPRRDAGAKRRERRALAADAIVRNAHLLRMSGSVTDISERGCKIELHVGSPNVEQIVTIKIEGMESWPGVVRWVNGHEVGVEFISPMHPAVVDHLSKTNPIVELV